jgi:flagellar M-ring protein FliF
MDSFMKLDANRRFGLLALVVGLILLAVFLGKRATTPDFVPLFRNLDLAEVGNITDRLSKASIVYQLGGDGSDVQVPRDDAARARVLLAKDGLPANGRPGLELFDKPSWGMTDFTQHITYRRALEGELARTIGTFKGVTLAQVHLALPEASPLRTAQRPAEAAVVVSLKPGTVLSAEQVQGITQLVSGSVEQLSADHVTVLDDTGRPLTGATGDAGASALTGHQADLQQSVEQHLATKVEQLLASAVGPSDLKVQVAARLNFDQLERTIDVYDTAGKVLSNEQRSQSSDTSAGGAGTIINNTYVNSRKMEKVVAGVGNITRLTVSVMLNSRALKGDVESQKTAITQLVRNAIGFDSTRGDQLSVLSFAFADPVPLKVNPADTAAVKTSPVETISKFSVPFVALLAVIVALILGFRALRPSREARQLAATTDPGAVGAGHAGVTFEAGGGLRQRIQAESSASPDAAARVVRAWLADAS